MLTGRLGFSQKTVSLGLQGNAFHISALRTASGSPPARDTDNGRVTPPRVKGDSRFTSQSGRCPTRFTPVKQESATAEKMKSQTASQGLV